MRDVDVVIANEEDLQCGARRSTSKARTSPPARSTSRAYREAAERVTREFGPSMVAITLRESLSASDNGWSAVLWDGTTGTLHQSQRYMVRLVDRIGGGDSFAAGLIYGLVTGRPIDAALRFAVAASALEADHSRRFQPRQRRRSGRPRTGRRFGKGQTLTEG